VRTTTANFRVWALLKGFAKRAEGNEIVRLLSYQSQVKYLVCLRHYSKVCGVSYLLRYKEG